MIIERRSKEETLIAAFNFSRQGQSVTIESTVEQLAVLFNTDWEKYGGKTPEQRIKAVQKRDAAELALPPFAGILLSPR